MSKIGLVLLGLLMVFSACVASSVGAECKTESGSKRFALCLGTVPVLTEGTFILDVENDTTHEYKLGTKEILKVLSTVVRNGNVGQIVSVGPIVIEQMELEFSDSVVEIPAHCAVAEPIVTEKLKGTILKREEIEFVPESGNTFATMKVQNNGGTCLVAGTQKVTGSPKGKGQVCTSKYEVSREGQLFECLGSGSHLALLEEAATFSGNFIVKLLEAGTPKIWAVREGK